MKKISFWSILFLCVLALALTLAGRMHKTAPAEESLTEKIRKTQNYSRALSDIRSNGIDAIAKEIKSGRGINVANQDGETPLHIAAENNDIEILRLLLENGADPRALAAESNDINMMTIRRLLEKKAEPRPRNRRYESAFSRTIALFNLEAFHILLDYYSHHGKYLANFKDSSLDTVLGYAQFLDLLLAYDVDFPANFMARAEDDARKDPSPEKEASLKKLREHFVKKERGEKLPPPPEPPRDRLLPPEKDQPLIEAVKAGKTDTVRALLTNGESPDQISAYYNDRMPPPDSRVAARPALSLALLLGHREIAKLLLDHGANPDLRGANYEYLHYKQDSCETPLILAVQNDDRDMAKALLEKKAGVNHPECNGRTPLSYATNREMAGLLLKAGADPNNSYVLLNAIERPDTDTMAFFLKNGLDINFRFSNTSPLHALIISCKYPRKKWKEQVKDPGRLCLDFVKLFVKHGADLKAQDKRNFTAYDWALDLELPDIADYLKKSGAVSTGNKEVFKNVISQGNINIVTRMLDERFDLKTENYVLFATLVMRSYKKDGDTEAEEKIRNLRKIVFLLVTRGADLKTPIEAGWSVLHATTDPELIDFFVARGINVNDAGDEMKNTPLHVRAICDGDPDAVRALLKNGALPNAKNAKGLTPLDVAVLVGPEINCDNRMSPITFAKFSPKLLETIRLLVKAGADTSKYKDGIPARRPSDMPKLLAEFDRKALEIIKAGPEPVKE